MTAFKLGGENVAGINHPCLVRKSVRTYELLDPKNPGEVTSFDVGQVKAIVEMDRRLREDDDLKSVPAGYSSFAQVFNKYAAGPERFATFSYKHGKPVITKAGHPIVWDHFLIDDTIIGRHYDRILEESGPRSSQLLSTTNTSTSDDPTSPSRDIPQLDILSVYMKNSMTTTDELVKFWVKRGAIEFDYASRLARLAERTIGEQVPSQLRGAIDAFRVEAARQAMNHNTLATQIAVELESRCLKLQLSQSTHWLKICEPSIKKLQEPVHVQGPASHHGVSSEWKREYKDLRYSLDIRRLRALRGSRSPFQIKGDTGFCDQNTASSSLSRKAEWSSLRKSCRKMEEERSLSMEELLSAFGDILSAIHDSHDESRTTIKRAIDLFKPQEVLEQFSNNFVDDDDIILDTDRPQQDTNPVGHPLRRSRSARSPRSLPKLQISSHFPEAQQTSKIEVQTEHGVQLRPRPKDQRTNEIVVEKPTFSGPSTSQNSRHKRLSGPRPLPLVSFVCKPLSRSVSSSSSNHRMHHAGQHNHKALPPPVKDKPGERAQTGPYYNLIDF